MRTPPIRSDPGKCRSASSLGLIGAGKSQQQGGKHRRRRTRGGAYRTVPDVCSVLFRIHFHRAYLNLLKNIISLFRRESSRFFKKNEISLRSAAPPRGCRPFHKRPPPGCATRTARTLSLRSGSPPGRRISIHMDTLGSITDGNYGGGHSKKYYKGIGKNNIEAFAQAYAAYCRNDKQFRLEFPNMTAYIDLAINITCIF